MKRREWWPYFGVAVLALLLYAGMACAQVGCPDGRCAVRPVSYSPAVATSPAVASPAVAGFTAAGGSCADGSCGESPAVASQDRFPVLKKLFRRVSHPLGGRFRR